MSSAFPQTSFSGISWQESKAISCPYQTFVQQRSEATSLHFHKLLSAGFRGRRAERFPAPTKPSFSRGAKQPLLPVALKRVENDFSRNHQSGNEAFSLPTFFFCQKESRSGLIIGILGIRLKFNSAETGSRAMKLFLCLLSFSAKKKVG